MHVKHKLRGNQVTQWIECTRKRDPPFADFTSESLHVVEEQCTSTTCICTQSTPIVEVALNNGVLEYYAMDAKLVDESMEVLQEGSTLWKVKSFSSWYRRRYVFDRDNRRILYEGSRKLPCLAPTDIIEIRDMHDIRKGWKTDTFNKIATRVEKKRQKQLGKVEVDGQQKQQSETSMQEICCFSVIYGPDHRTLDLVCPNEKLCNAWVRGLSHLIAVQRSEEREQNYKSWLKDQFRKADLDHSGALNFDECVHLLRQLNIEMNKTHAKQLFDEANTNKKLKKGEDVIDEEEFVIFYNLLKRRPELEQLFLEYTASSPMMGPFQLQAFLQKEQKMPNITIEDAQDIIDVYEPGEARVEGFMSADGFQKMLLADPMDIFNIQHRTVYQDMKQPLSHYYMASSHNTYLMADQLAGDSSVEGYIRALKSGCRCVELDLWDGPDGEPIIYHGYTLTSRILAKDVLQDALKPYSFATSEYPVMLSLENHLGVEQQKVLAKHFKNILGDMLYTSPISPDMSSLPSPFELKRKIIIKGKKLEHDDPGQDVSGSEGEDEVDEESSHKRVTLAPELSQLVNICKAVSFKSFEHSKQKARFEELSSLSERKASSLISSSSPEFIEYNERQIIRIYPAGKRQGSSNYDPISFWNVGCQIVALNYQTVDRNMRHNNAKFRDNGNCGFVLKPQCLLEGAANLAKYVQDKRYRKVLRIKIISGQHLPKPGQATTGEIIDPYVLVKIRGHPVDDEEVKTKHMHNNGFNPVWNESFALQVLMPDLAIITFTVRDYSASGRDEVLGKYSLPFNSIQVGYRHVHLYDKHYRSLVPASLFVHVAIE